MEFKPCPFCGGEIQARRVIYPNGDMAWSVMPQAVFGGCYMCSNIPHVESEDWGEFIEAWNRRTK